MSTNLTHSYGNGRGYGNITLLQHPSLCTLQTCDLTMAPFLYLPTYAGNLIYAIVFAVMFGSQCFFGIKHKTWGFMAAMLCGLVLEIVGYVARLMLHNSPFSHGHFLIYLVVLTIAPAFFTAAIYLCLARIIQVYGENLARFKPRTYTIVFCACDIISLVLQGLGGGIAANSKTLSASNLGKNIMLCGLIFQNCSLVLFVACCGEFAYQVAKGRGMRNPEFIDMTNTKIFKSLLIGLSVASVTIFTRSMYRCIELAGGFNSRLFKSDEALFMVLEGTMIISATACLSIFHPAIAFQGSWSRANFAFRTQKNGDSGALGTSGESGESAEEMQTFGQSQSAARFTRL